MRHNSPLWTQKEEQFIKTLNKKQRQNNYMSWEEIADAVSQKFNVNKTAKQCRDRFVNYLKFDENNSLNLTWSEEQTNILATQYLEKGSAWSYISTFLPNKSENSIKNKFNHSLKEVSRLINGQKIKLYRICKGYPNCRIIQQSTLSILLRTSNQIKAYALEKGLKINNQTALFRFRTVLVGLCFKPHIFSDDKIYDFIELIKKITTKLKACNIFRTKNRKLISSQNTIQAICQFDPIFFDYEVKSKEKKLRNKKSKEPVEQKNNQIQNNPTSIKIQQVAQVIVKSEYQQKYPFHHPVHLYPIQHEIIYNYCYYPPPPYWPIPAYEDIKLQP